ncbi:YgeY family selenium metabolism-linked hydrolase [Paradesulfitobacterium ferrireducens]|uniref:YgeY family selenium metabolism-linked hydrolase n=1 Tax=Paradesulfitobacterium ferrireducens TaxID=2816476 RepID=UPI001A908E9C|nr:YgeY family selenium metabolism-linked hydrolase [Paradesulfitobacterium ferrireducens]
MKHTLERVISLAQALVKRPSVTGAEQELARFLRRELTGHGFETAEIDSYGNVVGRIGQAGRPGLLFDAHIDTVGVHNGQEWHHEPFGGEISDGKIYGRGISDMKGAIAAALVAVAELREEGWTPSVPFWFSGTVCEEIAEGAALEHVLVHTQPKTVLIGEATGLRLAVGQRGRAEIVLEAPGKSVHSANAQLGINAIERATQALTLLQTKIKVPRSVFLGEGSLVVTDIISDPYPGCSVVPSRCLMTFDRRLLLAETPPTVLESIQNVLPPELGIQVKLAEYQVQTYTGAALSGERFFPAWYVAPSLGRVQSALDSLNEAGIKTGISTYSFCTNGSMSAGKRKIFTMGFGPGFEADAHTTDESMAVDQLVGAVQGYKQLFRVLANC